MRGWALRGRALDVGPSPRCTVTMLLAFFFLLMNCLFLND